MIASLVGVQMATAMAILGVMPLAPVYRDVFSLSRAQTGLLMTALFLGVVVASWASGRVTDRIGAKSVMLGAVLTVGTSFACLSPDPPTNF